MPIFHRILDQLADSLYSRRKVRLRFDVDRRIACTVFADIQRLIQDNRDGETYRCAIAHWTHAERAPLALYYGTSSFCRIDGPLQWVKDRSFPLGGLILSPGVTAHLDPFETRELHDHMKWSVERTIREWISDHKLRDLPPIPVEIDRSKADRKAKAMIANWAAREERGCPSADNDTGKSDHV